MISVPKPAKKKKRKSSESPGRRVGMLKKMYSVDMVPFHILKGEPKRVVELLCDEVWSKAIKERDRFQCVPKLLGFRHRCTNVLQSMHVFRRGKKKLRLNLDNGICGCSGAHVYFTYNEDEFHDLLRLKLPELMERLTLIKQTMSHTYSQDLKLIYVHLCMEFHNLLSGKGLKTYKL